MVGSFPDCCARATNGHAAAEPRSVMSSRRFTAQCLRASTEKDSTTRGSAAVRDFNAAYDRYGSKAAQASRAGGRFISAVPPVAEVNLIRQRLQRCAISDRMHRSKLVLIRSPRRRGRAASVARRDWPGRSRGMGLRNIGSKTAASVCLDVKGPDEFAPLLRFVGDELAKVSGREREHVATQVGKLRLEFRVGERGIDLPVELVDNFGQRAFG